LGTKDALNAQSNYFRTGEVIVPQTPIEDCLCELTDLARRGFGRLQGR